MTNMYDYIKKYGQKTFFEQDFNEIDAAILAMITYVDFRMIIPSKVKKITLKDYIDNFLNNYDLKDFIKKVGHLKSLIKLCKELVKSERYSNILVLDYTYKLNEVEQFGAMTLKLDDGKKIICFEGTDYNIVGWEEDFSLAYKFPIQAQKDAIKYFNHHVNLNDKEVFILGHSKGGNLAIISGMYANLLLKNKIKKIYNFDGPGLRKKQILSKRYLKIQGKIEHIVPDYSIIGLLLRHSNNFKAVKSRKDLLAHYIFFWETNEYEFKRCKLSRLSQNLDESIILWLDEHDDKMRKKITNDIFGFIRNSGIDNANELLKIKTLLNLFKNRKNLDEQTRVVLNNFIKFNFDYSIKKKKV